MAELWAGARPKGYDALNNLFQALTGAPIDEWTGRQAGAYLRQYRRSHGLEVADALIAGGAVVNRAELWTRNRKHYPMKDIAFSTRFRISPAKSAWLAGSCPGT